MKQKNIKKKEYAYNTPIESLHLSQRPYKVLMENKIDTVGKLAEFVKDNKEGLLSLRNLGERSENEILYRLAQIKVIGFEENGHEKLEKDTITGNVHKSQIIDNEINDETSQNHEFSYDTLIENLHLSHRSYKCLRRNKIDTVGKLAEFVKSNKDGLLNFRNLGTKSAQEILNVLDGIKLIDSVEDSCNDSIDDYGFSQHTKNTLEAQNIKTVSELNKHSLYDIKEWKGIDKYTLYEISHALGTIDVSKDSASIQNGSVCHCFLGEFKEKRTDKKSIEEYNFSNRAKHVFENKQIKTFGDLKCYSIEEIKRWKNVGQKTIDEIVDALCLMKEDVGQVKPDNHTKDRINICLCISEDEFRFYTISFPFYNRLLSMGFENGQELETFLNKEERYDFHKESTIDSILFHNEFMNTRFFRFCESIARELNEFSGDNKEMYANVLIAAIHCILFDYVELEGIIYVLDSSFCSLVCKDKIYLETVKKKELEILETETHPISVEDFYQYFPLVIQNSGLVYTALCELEKAGVIRKLGNESFEIILPSVVDYIDSVKDEKTKDILKRKIINGQSLEEIANEYNVTRERVRQIIKKSNVSSKNISFSEDKYAFIYQKYNFKKKEAKLIFGDIAANYFFLRYEPGTIALEESLEDKSIPQDMRKRIQNEIVYTDYISVGNQYVKRFRPALYDYYIRHYCTEDIELDIFIKEYSAFWERHGVEKEIYEVDSRTIQGQMSKKKNTLYKYPRTFRFYDFDQYDFTDLLDTLNLSQYENVMLSTAKFTKDYPKLMKRYDIRDEYELHSLLRTLLEDKENNITFHRMPGIEFGKADVNAQVLELLNENAPVSPEKLSLLYEEKYGTQAMTVRANYFNCISKYLHNGLYIRDLPSLTDDEFEYLKRQLTDDFYTISEVKKIFTQKFVSESHVNPMTLKELGFIVNEKHIVKENFKSTASYFKYLLTRGARISYEDIPYEIRHIATFNMVLNNLLDDYEIVEYDKKKYLNFSKLSSIGIIKEDIHDFCKEIYSLNLSEFFGMKQVKETGFKHKLFELGFDDWFYERILSRNDTLFSSQQIGGSIVLSKGRQTVTWVSLLEYILPEEGMDIHRLAEKLNADYGMRVSKNDILARIIESNLYYDKIMEKLYICYADYFAEV